MICAIVLAAGRSERMGTQKALLPFAGSTVIARVVDALTLGGADQVIVVLRSGDSQARDVLQSRPVTFVENPDPAGDMLSSLRCGLRVLPANATTIAVSPVDQPSLTPGLVRRLLQVFASHKRQIVVPVHRGRRGHPLLIAAHYRAELLTSYDDVGLRGLLRAHPEDVTEWETEDSAVIQDVDTLSDYREALRTQG